MAPAPRARADRQGKPRGRQPSARLVPVLLAALLLVPATHAGLNQPADYQAAHGYMAGFGGAVLTMASGRMEAVVPSTEGSFGFVDTEGATLSGLTRACWDDLALARRCANGALSLRVLAGGSFGLNVPGGADAEVQADHALAMFSDLARQADLNGLGLGKSLVAPTVGGEAVLSGIAGIATDRVNEASRDGGALVGLDAATTVEVRDGTRVLATVRGKGDPLTFAGTPALSPLRAGLVVVPFDGGGSVARFRQADPDAAAEGLDAARINALMRRLHQANQGSPTRARELPEDAFAAYGGLAEALFAGAVLSVPTDGSGSGADLEFARTPRLQVSSIPNGGLAWDGVATLQIRDGHVVGGPQLHGWGFLALPWWGWLLWVAAVAAWVVRLVRRPPRENERWDRRRWVGWVAGPLAFLALFLLWDLEMRSVVGASLLSGAASGQLLLLVGLVQLATFAYVAGAVVLPSRMLLRNGSLLLGQGTFMGLAGAAACVLGYLFGAWLLRPALDLVVAPVLAGFK